MTGSRSQLRDLIYAGAVFYSQHMNDTRIIVRVDRDECLVQYPKTIAMLEIERAIGYLQSDVWKPLCDRRLLMPEGI